MEVKFLEACAQSYLNAQQWNTGWQILSFIADNLSLNDLRQFFPTITSYRYNIALLHSLFHGRAAPVPCNDTRRMRIKPAKT